MKLRMLALSIAALLVAHVTGADPIEPSRQPSEKGQPVLVVLDTSVGIVLPRGGTLWGHETVWEPDAKDVKRAEKSISAFLRANAPTLADHLTAYVRQYSGVVEGGRRKIYCSFLHETHFQNGGIRENIKRLSVGIVHNDGGDHFFRLLYDPETDSCSELAVNGDA